MQRMRRLAVTVGVLLAAGLLLAACGGKSGGGGGTAGGAPGGAPGEVTVKATEFSFDPKEIRVKAGQSVTLVLRNEGSQQHDLVIDNIPVTVGGQDKTGVQVDLVNSGGQGRVTFTPKQAGRYEFYCSVPGHKAAGMVGTLVVE